MEQRRRLEERAAGHQGEANQLRRREGAGEARFRPERIIAETHVAEDLAAIAGKQQEIQAKITEQKRLGLELTQQEQHARQAGIGLQQQELALLIQREQRTATNARRLGSQNPIERQAGLRAAQFIKQYGLGRATPDLVGQAGRFAPDWLAKQQEQFGEQMAEYKQGQREGFFGLDQQSLRSLRQQINESQSKVQVNVVLDAQAVAAATADQLRKFADRQSRALANAISAVERQARQNQALGFAAEK
jgi:hypothetical protein